MVIKEQIILIVLLGGIVWFFIIVSSAKSFKYGFIKLSLIKLFLTLIFCFFKS